MGYVSAFANFSSVPAITVRIIFDSMRNVYTSESVFTRICDPDEMFYSVFASDANEE
jgi:hypothetical protein